MNGKKLRVKEMKERFGNVDPFTYIELYEFFLEKEPDLKIGTFKWRVYYLKKEGVIRSLKRGIYIFETRRIYTPPITNKLKKIFNLLKKQFPYTSISVWDTSWLNEFMIHQPIKSNIIVEVNRDSMNSVFAILKLKYGEVYLDPNQSELKKYVLSSDGVYVIKPLLVNSPIVLYDNVFVPKIEKILVDIFVEENLFIAYQGQEKINIFDNVFENYSVNLTTLFRYASKRRVKEKLINFMKMHTSIQRRYLEV